MGIKWINAGSNYFNDYSKEAVPLYNGNISALSESIYNLWNRGILKLFRYDKLNRIKRMRTAAHHFEGSGWETPSDNFATDYTYDWNGNLLSLRRKNQYGEEMHDIRYTYPNGNNRLGSIAATGISSSVYQYDALGNLVRDNAEGLTVGWNALGKVDTIRRNGNLLSAFRYSPTGQRQVKTDSSGTAFYIHDATGNVMCIYRQDGDTLRATERYLYGSKRLGMLEQQVWIAAGGVARLQDASTIGARVYEFTDHLGNVTYTAQDRKYLVPDSYGQLQYFPSTVTYTDYYPFGYPMPGRSSYMGGYRYFFNGQEGDDEVLGEGALHAFEYRMHDTRIGRFWSVDPLAGKFPWNSVYAFAENRVVDGRELEGLEVVACFSNTNNDLAIIPDASKCNPSLEYKWVSAFEYSKLTDSQKKEYNYGIYVQNVFSGGHLVGNTIVRGNGGSQKEIPIPMGIYNILENKDNTKLGHDKFFVLDPQDNKQYNKIDDRPGIVNSEGEQRSGYNLHPGETSWGCVTAAKRTPEMNESERAKEWDIIYDAIINTTSTLVPDKRGRHRFLPWEKQVKYGTLEVID